MGRSTVLIKGIASRLGVRWSLADEWAPIARQLLDTQSRAQARPLGAPPKLAAIVRLLGSWMAAKLSSAVMALPSPVRGVLAAVALRVQRLAERSRRRRQPEAPAAPA